jgi:hypothetical protein
VRLLVRVIACLLGLAIAVAGALVVLEVAWAWVRPGRGPLLVPWPEWRAYLEDLTWQSGTVRIAAGVLAAAGLLMLLIALTAHRRDVALQDPASDVSVQASPASLARVVGQRVRAEENVSGATVIATARRVRVRASSRLESEAELRPRLLAVVRETVQDLPLVRTPRISVVVHSRRDHQ